MQITVAVTYHKCGEVNNRITVQVGGDKKMYVAKLPIGTLVHL